MGFDVWISEVYIMAKEAEGVIGFCNNLVHMVVPPEIFGDSYM